MAKVTQKPATYDDIVALPEHVVGEIVDGELFVSPRPRFGHAHVAAGLGVQLGGTFGQGRGGPGGWWIFPEVELHFGKNVLVPDLAGWRVERMPKPPAPSEPFSTLAPDWVCEILSPSTARVDYEKKLPHYGREGVSHVWIVHPANQAIEVFRRAHDEWILALAHSGDEKIRIEPFDALELDLGALWLPEEGPAGQK